MICCRTNMSIFVLTWHRLTRNFDPLELKAKGFPQAYVGDVVGTGSSRKSATNSVLWFMGDDVPYIPNKRGGGVCIGGKIAPIFFNTMEDSGALPIEVSEEEDRVLLVCLSLLYQSCRYHFTHIFH